MKGKGAIIAAAVAGLFLLEGCTQTTSTTPVDSKAVRCLLPGAGAQCGGKNGCPTQNIVNNLTPAQCKQQGGMLVQ
jgi:hypothetical protein